MRRESHGEGRSGNGMCEILRAVVKTGQDGSVQEYYCFKKILDCAVMMSLISLDDFLCVGIYGSIM